MSKVFETLQNKVKEADKSKLKDLIPEVKQAADDGEITEKEKEELVKLAKEQLGEPFSGFNI